MATWFEVDDTGRASRVVAGTERLDFGVRSAELGMMPLPYHLSIAQEYRPNHGIRGHTAPTFASQLQGSRHRFTFVHGLSE